MFVATGLLQSIQLRLLGSEDDIGHHIQKSDEISTSVSAIGVEWWGNALQWLINMNSWASAVHLNHWPSEVDNRAISERVLKLSIFVKYEAGLLVFQCHEGYSWPLLTFELRVIFTKGHVLNYFSKLSKYSFSTATSVGSLKSLLLSRPSITGVLYCLPRFSITNWLTGFSLISITKNLNDVSPRRDSNGCFHLVLHPSEWLNQRWTAFRRSISIFS